MTVIEHLGQRQAHPPVALGLERPRPCRSRRPRSSRPETATRARRNFSRRWRRAASASSGGSSVRSVRRRPPDPAHLVDEDVADLAPVAVDRRDQDVRRQVVPELDDQLGEVGLPDVDARPGERLVELDLLGRHRLDLDDLGRAVRRGRSTATIAFASAASRAQWTMPPAAVTAASSCSSSAGRSRRTSSLIAAPASRSSSQSARSATARGALRRGSSSVARPRFARSCSSASAVRAASGNGGVPGEGRLRRSGVVTRGPRSRRGSRRGA